MLTLTSPMTGTAIPMNKVPDEIFAADVLGRGVAIDPADGMVVAPCDGVVSNVAATLHAVCLTADGGEELLVHIGIDTVSLGGKGFTCYVREGQRVTRGEKLMKLDLRLCRKKGLSPISPLVVLEPELYRLTMATGSCRAGDTVLVTAERLS